MRIREHRDEDRDALVKLIGGCYREYDYDLFLDGYDADLLDVKGTYLDAGGAFWVLDEDGVVRASAALKPSGGDAIEVRRMYAESGVRGKGWMQKLLVMQMDWARQRGYTTIVAWSDVRFERAHAFYRKAGFLTDDQTRDCDDFSEPYTEMRFYQAI